MFLEGRHSSYGCAGSDYGVDIIRQGPEVPSLARRVMDAECYDLASDTCQWTPH